MPPAVALALEPRVERVISLELADVVAQIPDGYIQPIDTLKGADRILVKAAEVEKGMANGRPTVSLATIHQQVPHIFLREVAAGDTTQIALPFGKVLDEFTKLQVRSDQVRPGAVPQVETPFLKVTMEDNERFGTTTEILETGDFPPVRVQPPTALSFADAEPEPVIAPPPLAPAPATVTGAPRARIPFKLSPNGTDAPATESVPASAGPSVPSGEAAAPPPAPMRIPFKIPSAAASEAAREPDAWLTAEKPNLVPDLPATGAKSATGEVKIRIGLKTILQTLPPFQLTGDPGSVPDDVRIELPFSIVEPQLASGRISITPMVFQVAIPQSFRGLFNAEGAAADIILPLQEVLKNLPTTSLRMRHDQVEQEAGANFATPFSAKAEEDAKRFNVSGTPVAKPAAALPEVRESEPQPSLDANDIETRKADAPLRSPLQVALDTDEKLDAKSVVAHLNRMPGVKASAIMFADGLSLAGSLPAEFQTDALCAMAPSLLQRIDTHMGETKLGALRGMTLSCAKGAVTFFMHDNLCLAAMHSNGEISAEVREKLGRVIHELSRKYSHPV
ncbi:MAG: roadblock/LC7 domain-containing protein [Verrucomicrobiota bacterium]|nr:roadblock/LC7 domain-containing protein [Verrucomicrobiota bacterium]